MCISMIVAGVSSLAESLSAVAPTIEAISTLYSAGASYSAAKSGQAMSEANAKLAEQQGLASLRKGQQESDRIDRQARRVQGAQRAAYGAAGVDPNSGTPLEMQADTLYQAEQDKSLVRYNAELQKWGFDVEAANYRAQADAYGNKATGAIIGGVLGAGSSLLTGLGQVSGKWAPMQTTGPLTLRQKQGLDPIPRMG